MFQAKNRIAFAILLFLLTVGSLPYMVAYYQQDAQHAFWGTLHYPEDMDSYAAWTKKAADGEIVWSNPYDVSGSDKTYINSLWLISGWAMRVTGLSFAGIFQVLRIGAGISLVAALWWFATTIGMSRLSRKFLLVLAVFGGGLGWIQEFVRLPAASPDRYTELWPFIQAVFVPHTALALAVALWAIGLAWRADRDASIRDAIKAGAILLLLGSFRPYDLLTAWVTLALFLLWSIISEPSRKQRMAVFLAALLPALPAFAYAYWLSHFSDGFAVWSQTNRYPPPGIGIFLLSLGVAFPGALMWLGSSVLNRDKLAPASRLLIVWMVVSWLLIYSGAVPFAWRTCALFVIPHLAAFAMLFKDVSELPRIKKQVIYALAGFILLLSLPTTVLVLQNKVQLAEEQNRYFYTTPAVQDSLDWLGKNTNAAVVLTHGHIGQKIPAFANARSLLGHKDLTPGLEDKREAYQNFANAKTPKVAEAILNRYGIDTIFWGPLDRRFGSFDPARLSGWQLDFENGLVTIYRKHH